MKKRLQNFSVIVIRSVFLFLISITSAFAQQADTTGWWKKNNLRVIQYNLPAYEAATIDADSLVTDLVHCSANTLIINAGGIMAFYPSRLPFHYINPYSKSNTLRDIIAKCHEKNIKVIVRFDFSRVHENIFKQHPDWCYISPDGERIINTDMYVVSINAPYVQEAAFSIVKEVIDEFPVDGIFLNMPGYQTRNPYEGKYHGIDQNKYDKEAFYKFSGGLQLPIKENKEDSVFQKYLIFKKITIEHWMERLNHMIKAKNKQIAICTYMDKYVDIIRHESQTNSLPYWPYSASDNVANAANSFPGHIISNSSIQQISFQSRFNAVEPEEVSIRLYENIANGSGLDISMMGDMRNYEDERNYATIKRIYSFHKKNEMYFGKYTSLAKIAIVAPGAWPSGDPMQEYRGLQLILREAHIPFDIIEDAQIENLEKKVKEYKVIILPDITYLSTAAKAILKSACDNGTVLIATNKSFSDDPQIIKNVFGATITKIDNDGSGSYISVSDHAIFKRMALQSIVSWKFNIGLYDFSKSDERLLPIYTKGRPGPPEITGGHEPSGYYAAGLKKNGKGTAVLIPVNIGKLYYLHGYKQHKNMLLDLLDYTYPAANAVLKTTAPERVEIIPVLYKRNKGIEKSDYDGLITHCINITGFSGNTYFAPLPVRNIEFNIQSPFKPTKVYKLTDKKPINFIWKGDRVILKLSELNEYEAIVMDW